MTETDVEIVIQKARESFPGTSPRLISDNGSQFISKEFKVFMGQVGMVHTRTSPYYPQSNGKLERCNKTIKEFLRKQYLCDLDDGKRVIQEFINYYNNVRLHSAINYITPSDKLAGNAPRIIHFRKQKLLEAQKKRNSCRRRSSLELAI